LAFHVYITRRFMMWPHFCPCHQVDCSLYHYTYCAKIAKSLYWQRTKAPSSWSGQYRDAINRFLW